MRIGYFADGPWSHKALEKLIRDDTIEVAFIVPRISTSDKELLKYSNKFSIDYLHPHLINSKFSLVVFKKYKCDLFVSMSFDQIFKKNILQIPKIGTINCHAGKLPYYRGRNVLNWVLINDEKEFGITVHLIDEGIDTGDIILQKTYPISDNDTYSSLLELAYEECANLLYEAIKQIQTGGYNLTKQSDIHPVGFYCGKRGKGDEIIDWQEDSRSIFNFIRAISSPGPIATTFLFGVEVKINSSRIIINAPVYKGKPGQILLKTDSGYLVKTKDSFLEITDIYCDKKIKVGDVLG